MADPLTMNSLPWMCSTEKQAEEEWHCLEGELSSRNVKIRLPVLQAVLCGIEENLPDGE